MKIKINRVDIQVCIFTAVVVIVSSFLIYLFNYYLTYKDMLIALNDRAVSIYNYIDNYLDNSIFTEINSIEDQSKQSYKDMKATLEKVKNVTGVMYLYTAKKTENGELIYVVDGLPSDSSDFRNAGDKIEKEIYKDMEKALKNEIIMPKKIKNTEWGHIFVCYFPIHNQNEVIGVLGIEFEAEHQYFTFKTIRIISPLITFLSCFTAVFVALKLFKRISNPTYKDFANTDQLTGLKNRNAFEVDMNNFINMDKQNSKVIFSIDLNDLKKVNDNFGHRSGDEYIKSAAKIIENSIEPRQSIYRIGGDEFVIILDSITKNYAESIIQKINKSTEELNENFKFKVSMAIGYAFFDKNIDENIFKTYGRADEMMYSVKRSQKEKSK